MKTTLDRTLFHNHLVTGPWVIFADVPEQPEYCYVGDIYTEGPVGGKWKAGSQFFIAHKDMLKPAVHIKEGKAGDLMGIESKALTVIEEVRKQIESGTHKIVSTRLVAA